MNKCYLFTFAETLLTSKDRLTGSSSAASLDSSSVDLDCMLGEQLNAVNGKPFYILGDRVACCGTRGSTTGTSACDLRPAVYVSCFAFSFELPR